MKRKINITIFTILFILLLLLVLFNKMNYIDEVVYDLIINLKSNKMTNFMKVITFFASVKFMIIITMLSFITLLFKKKFGLLISGLIVIDVILNSLIKNIVKRPRPIGNMLVKETSYSFPSGHTMADVTFYGTIIYLINKSKINKYLKISINFLIYCLIILIMISRIYLGVHYFSDVLGGALISLIYLNIVFYLIERKENESINNRSK